MIQAIRLMQSRDNAGKPVRASNRNAIWVILGSTKLLGRKGLKQSEYVFLVFATASRLTVPH